MKNMCTFLLLFSCLGMNVKAELKDDLIPVADVNMKNYEQFVKQIRRDLPVGTSIDKVKKYLSDRDISYGHASVEGNIKFMVKKIYSAFFVFKTDLQVKIFVSESTGVSQVKSSLIETAF